MADELVLYTNPMSPGRIARWVLEEVGQPYKAEILEYASMKSPDYLAINPMGKVPAVRHGDTIVTEAAAICAYLADAFPKAGLAPPSGSRLRGPYYRWLFFGAGPIEAANTNKALKLVVPAERTKMVGYGTQEEVLAALEDQLNRSEYIASDRFTAADVYVGAQIGSPAHHRLGRHVRRCSAVHRGVVVALDRQAEVRDHQAPVGHAQHVLRRDVRPSGSRNRKAMPHNARASTRRSISGRSGFRSPASPPSSRSIARKLPPAASSMVTNQWPSARPRSNTRQTLG